MINTIGQLDRFYGEVDRQTRSSKTDASHQYTRLRCEIRHELSIAFNVPDNELVDDFLHTHHRSSEIPQDIQAKVAKLQSLLESIGVYPFMQTLNHSTYSLAEKAQYIAELLYGHMATEGKPKDKAERSKWIELELAEAGWSDVKVEMVLTELGILEWLESHYGSEDNRNRNLRNLRGIYSVKLDGKSESANTA